MSQVKKTPDQDEIRSWVEARSGEAARVKSTAGNGGRGVLRLDFQELDDALEPVSRDEVFKVFGESHLALLERRQTGGGGRSRFLRSMNR